MSVREVFLCVHPTDKVDKKNDSSLTIILFPVEFPFWQTQYSQKAKYNSLTLPHLPDNKVAVSTNKAFH